MPPRKKPTNPGIASECEWIPGSKMVFEIPDVRQISKSRRITQRFTSSLKTIEKEEFSPMHSIISPPGVKTRLRRQSFFVGKSIPNVSFSVTNSSVSICVSEKKSTPQSDQEKRVSPSKMVTRTKSSDSVSKITSSKSSTDVLFTGTMKGLKKSTAVETVTKTREKSLERNQLVDATKACNLLETDEIVAIIDNQRGNRKRKSTSSIVNPDEENKHIKFDRQHLEADSDLRRSPRIARMKRNKALKNLKEKTLNKTQKKTKKNDGEKKTESLIKDRAETAKENKVEKRTPKKKKSPIKSKKEVESEVKRKTQVKDSPTKMRIPRKSMRNPKVSDEKKKVRLSKSFDVVETKFTEVTGKRKRGSSTNRKSVRKEEVELEINESPTSVKTSRKRQSMKNAYVDLGKKDSVLVKMSPKKVKINLTEEENKTNKVSEKSVTLTTGAEQAETERNSVEIENADKHVEEIESETSDDAKEERKETAMKSVQVEKDNKKETTTKRVTRQMASTEQIDSGRKKTLQKGKKTSPSKMIRGTEVDSQIVNKSQVSAKSGKTKKSIQNRNSPRTNSSFHRAIQSDISEKEIISPNISSKCSKKILRKLTPTRGVSCKKMSQKKSVADDNESKPSENKVTDISFEINFENKPQESLSSTDTIFSKIKLVPQSSTEKQNIIKESIESCKSSSWSLKSLFKNFGKKSSQCEVLPKDGEEVNENVSTSREMSSEKVPPERTGLFSLPLLSSTPDVARKPQADAKTSFTKSLQKTVSNLSPFSFKKSFEYTRTSIASANNQTIEESVQLQKVEHSKVNNEENTIENNETQMNVDTPIMSKKIEESSQLLLDNQMQFECQESEMEIDKKAMTNDDSSTCDCIDVGFNASVSTKAEKSAKETSTLKMNVHYESQSEDELVVDVNEEYESHFSEQEDLVTVGKSIHYESQQSEDETRMSQDDPEEILKEDDTNGLEKLDQEAEQEDLVTVAKNIHYESQQSEDETHMSQDDPEEILKEDDTNGLEKLDQEAEQEDLVTVAKNIHYESQQSEDETRMSQDDPEEILKEDDTNGLEKLDQEAEQEDLVTVAKNIHYESQQSEDETRMSQDDPEEILKEDDTNGLEKLDQEANNMLEPENMFFDSMKSHSNSQSEIEDCDIICKELHYESLQSNILVSKIENDCKISEKEEEENFDVNAYNASYSNYGLRCIIL